MTPKIRYLARLSLAFLWIYTALVSAVLSPELGLSILAKAEVTGSLALFFLYAGAGLDLLLGCWLLTGKQMRWCYQIQLLTVVVFTLLLTYLAPEYWLHPFGPVSKNVPILALIMLLAEAENLPSERKSV